MIEILRPLFTILLVVFILIIIAILSTGCNSQKLGKVVLHETICEDDCHNDMLDICSSKYEIVKLTTILDKRKILFYCQ